MNIVVVGGGTFGHFGNDFVRQAKAEGHDVRVLSHRTSKDTNETINFLNPYDVVSKFNSATEEFKHIDIFLYNTTYKGYPDDVNNFTSQSVINEKLYLYGFYVNVIVPHRLAIEALKRMNNTSKILFMTTDVIYDRERSEQLHKLSYYGGKAYQHQLMLALAKCNDKDAIVSSISPYFDYENKENYKKAFEQVYEHIFSKTENGKVFDCWNDYA
jgi:nucleoside-diphosphate-sugar epimerase